MGFRFRRKPEEPGWRPIIVLSTAVILACISGIGWYYSYLQDSLFAERQAVFTQFAEKTAENIDSTIEDYWHRNSMCQEFIAFSGPQSEEGLISDLAYCAETINAGQATVLAFDEKGRFYSSDGHTGRFSHDDAISFASGAPARQTAIANLPYESTGITYFLLFASIEQPLQVSQVGSLTHLALAIEVNSMQTVFATHGFGENCHTYFVTDTGRKLYQSSDSHSFIEGYNILSDIQANAKVIDGGTMADLAESFKSGDPTAFEISYHGENWFVSFQTVSEGKHHLITFAPTDLIGNNAAELSTVSLWALLLICLLLGLLLVTIVISVGAMMKKLREVNGLLEKQAKAADEANRAKSEFLSYMSHDIRTPINGIMGMTSIALKNTHDPDKVADCLRKTEEASGHLLSLVNDVLDLSRIEQGKTAIVSKPMSLPALLEECASIVEGQLATRNLDFIRDFGQMTHPHVLSDELHLRQILINILGNAVKFTPDGGQIAFRARQRDAGAGRVLIEIIVEDTGIGMDQSYLESIWEPFSQSRQGHCATYEGTGLGMAITKRFVDMMEGEISVESELGRGSTFTVRLTASICEESSTRGPIAETDCLNGLRVLLVEDKELNREIAQEVLKTAGAIPICTVNGQEALDLFTGSPAGSFDVILMDVMMPVMDGLEATRAIRASEHPESANIPIIALTAHAFDEDVRKTLEAGMNDHLSKPIDEQALTRVLRRYCTAEDRRPASAPASLNGANILLAEDDELNREIACVVLEEHGANVVQAQNGADALEAFANSAEGFFDVVLMDLHMPVMGGIEAARRLRALDRPDAADVPVFALTADFSPEEGSEFGQAGIDTPLLKPLNVKLLVQAISERASARSASFRYAERP